MAASIESIPRTGFRLSWGWPVLEKWAATASQVEKNAIDKALFEIVDRSAFQTYDILDDPERPREFFVIVRADLAIKIRVRNLAAFGIVYIGPPDEALDLDRATAGRPGRSRRYSRRCN